MAVCLYPGLPAQAFVCIFDWVYERSIFQCMYVHMCVGNAGMQLCVHIWVYLHSGVRVCIYVH